MGVLRFDGVDDRVRWTTLASALRTVTDGAWTCAVLLRRASIGSFDGITYMLDAAGTAEEAGFSIADTNGVVTDDVGEVFRTFAGTFTSTTDTIILSVSKAAGTVAPRLGSKNVTSGAAWAHAAGSGTIADQVAADIMAIGAWEGADPADAWIGLVGWWEGAMSDLQKEDLSVNKKTSDWWNHSFGAPKFLCQLNVAPGSLVDLAGNATSLATFGGGPTLDAGVTLESWDFDGTGAAALTYPTAPIDFQRSRFPFVLGDGWLQGVARSGSRWRVGGRMGPSPLGGFQQFLKPRLHASYSATQFLDLIAASELNAAQALTKFKSKLLGNAAETDVAQVLAKFKNKSLGVVATTNTAQAITKFKNKSVGVATEADAAQALSITHVHFKTLGVATELDVSQALTKIKSKLLGTVTQTNTAQTLSVTKIKILIPATETDAAQLLSFSQGSGDILMTLTPATEADVAQTLLKFKGVSIGTASELDAAQVLTHLKRVALGVATETDTAQTLIHLKRLSLSPVVTTNVAQALTRYKSKTLGVVSESDIAQAFVYTKTIFRTLNPALEFDVAVPLTIAGQEVVIVYRYRGPIIIGRF